MVRWLRWHCPPDTGFEIRALAVWGRARYLSVTEAPRNTDFHTWMGKKHFCFFQTAESGNRTPNSGVKGSGANHYPRAPAPLVCGSTIHVRRNTIFFTKWKHPQYYIWSNFIWSNIWSIDKSENNSRIKQITYNKLYILYYINMPWATEQLTLWQPISL